MATPEQALHADEVQRMRVFFAFIGVLTAALIPLLIALPGDPLATRLHAGMCAVTATVCAVLLWIVRDPDRYRPWHVTLFGHVAVVTLSAAYYFWGVFSGVLLIAPIGTFMFALGRNFRGALSIHLHATAAHALLATLQIERVIDDVALLRAPELPRAASYGVLLALQFVFNAAFVMARGLRRNTFAIMEQLDRAVRDAAHREALLNEARQDLAAAMRIGGPGRFTDQVIGSFRLGPVIGRGAMGEVYDATHIDTGEPAAVKLLSRDAMAKPDAIARFERELHIAASLTVPNVVRVLEVADASAPVRYLAMERLYGETLADILRRTPRLAADATIELLRALADGLAAAHESGIVHRDLKPRNIFRHQRPTDARAVWKILDFGVSKLGDSGGTLTQGHIVGTPTYMAPEQARGDTVDHRADIYACGAIAYRVLTGRPAFTGRDVPAILRAVVYDTPPQPSRIAPIPPEVDLVLAVALAKNPDDRFASANEFAGALAEALAGSLRESLRARAHAVLASAPWGVRDAR
ncbi:MAG: serine/threonine protein kinase [Deltaproteobacteria bacterium]|nr:MAG: serine/threonine protein kinase [Deltaproteobacteria bacterium]